LTGLVIKSTGSWYSVLDEKTLQINYCKLRGKFKMKGTKFTNPIAVGDIVDFALEADNTGVISNIHDRKNYIVRKSTNLSKHAHIIAANLDQAVLIATIAFPRTTAGFIDRFLATAEAYSIPSCIVFNKKDLYNKEHHEKYMELQSIYEPLGYKCYLISVYDKSSVDELNSLLKDKVSLMAGHSGVGKSTIINTIESGLNLKTGEISSAHNKGKHTTTFAEMFQLSAGGFIIDTPGIKEFGLSDVEPWEVAHYFPEMRALFNECKFDNCTHNHEPGCKVIEELKKGNISISRYSSYLSMLFGDDNRG
jgi:ribosome biogenesis GTPase / thiamine phosphate phosphatase